MSDHTQIGVRVRRERWWGKTTWTEGSKYPPTHLAIPLDAAAALVDVAEAGRLVNETSMGSPEWIGVLLELEAALDRLDAAKVTGDA